MDEKVLFTELFEVYKNLLTDRKREIFELYYLCDLSLGEIAEIKNISRQSVLDAIKSAKTELKSYEEKLSFLKIKQELLDLADTLDDKSKARLSEIIEE